MSSIIRQIESGNLELFALEFGKIAESDFVYTPASTNIDKSASNLVKIYIHKISDEFDFGTNRIRTSGVICP